MPASPLGEVIAAKKIKDLVCPPPDEREDEQTTYRIVRFFKDMNKSKEVIEEGLSWEEARAHCEDPSTCREQEWFDGFERET